VALDMTEESVISRDFPDQIRRSLDAAGAEAARLEITIAAQTCGNRLPDLLNGLDALRDVGVQIGLDDFASTGLGLAQLSRLPVDRLKLDRSLISGLPDSHEDCSVVSGVVGIARTLGLATVADGVEREDQLRLTREIGFDEVQGSLLCDPLDGEDFRRRCLVDA
jgi:EAL domain-containing protein (putative c-di-GMP-specific phosphodiesterase class I)